MNALTSKQAAALRAIVSATIAAVKEAGPTGAPAGVLYAAMMAHGASKSQFDSLMGALVRAGKLSYDAGSYTYHMPDAAWGASVLAVGAL